MAHLRHSDSAGPLLLQSSGPGFTVDEHKIEAVYDQSSFAEVERRRRKEASASLSAESRRSASGEMWKLLGLLAAPSAPARDRARPSAGPRRP